MIGLLVCWLGWVGLVGLCWVGLVSGFVGLSSWLVPLLGCLLGSGQWVVCFCFFSVFVVFVVLCGADVGWLVVGFWVWGGCVSVGKP